LIIGADPKSSGQVILEGRQIQINHPADAVRQGIAYVPEDRKALGLVLPMTVRENSTMAIHRRIQTRLGLIRASTERVLTDEFIEKLQIRLSSREQITRELSGGNQQKVVLAKWLLISPKVLILDEPTRGIDIGAKAEVHRLVAQLADQGLAILLISCELPEILHLADRVAVMHEGRLTAEFNRSEATEEAIMKAALA
jgi:ABC-type sugar transport system ATPase subunit